MHIVYSGLCAKEKGCAQYLKNTQIPSTNILERQNMCRVDGFVVVDSTLWTAIAATKTNVL